MIAQIEESVFPRRADLEGIVSDGCYSSVRRLLQGRGVFLACKKDDFSSQLSRFVMGEDFYQEAFGQFERTHHGIALTGIRFKAADGTDLAAVLRARKGVELATKYAPKLASVDGPDANGALSCKIQYEKLNPKFAAYRRREVHEVEVLFRVLEDGMVEVCSTPRSNTDAMVVRDVATDVMNSNDGELFNMDISQFAVEDRVVLFDKLIKDSSSREWRIEEVCGLSVRSADVDETERVLNDSETRVLHSAVLEGKGLREHQIVKDLVEDRFFFYSATVWTWSANVNQQIRLRIDFKQKPHVLVVTAETAQEVREGDGGNEVWETVTVPRETGQNCARWYWELVHSQFEELLESIRSRARTVNRDGGAVGGVASESTDNG